MTTRINWKPSDLPSPLFIRHADALYDAVAARIASGHLDARSEIADAALDYREERDEMVDQQGALAASALAARIASAQASAPPDLSGYEVTISRSFWGSWTWRATTPDGRTLLPMPGIGSAYRANAENEALHRIRTDASTMTLTGSQLAARAAARESEAADTLTAQDGKRSA